jgi:hypothetical protein
MTFPTPAGFVSSLKSKLLIAAVFVLASASSQAQIVTVFTNEGDFITAAQAVGTQSFTDDLNSYSSDAWPITLNDLSVSGGSLAFPNSNASTTVDSSNYLRLVTSNGTVTFTFDSPVIAFGFETNPHTNGVGDTLGITAGSVGGTFSMPSTDVTEFRGFVSDTAFTTFTINAGDGDSFYGFDNLVGYSASAVPEPGSYALVLGFLVTGFVANKRRRAGRS